MAILCRDQGYDVQTWKTFHVVGFPQKRNDGAIQKRNIGMCIINKTGFDFSFLSSLASEEEDGMRNILVSYRICL